MALLSDLKILWHMAFTKNSSLDHAERLEAFYSSQMEGYDDFRSRLLHGRESLMKALPIHEGDTLIDMGGGTGSNLDALGDKLRLLKSATVVDLCPSLLKVTEKRINQRGWTNVFPVYADATCYKPGSQQVDAITFSYSLTMIPNWFEAIKHAISLLKPGGILGVVDFYISRKWPDTNHKKHSRFTRFFWPAWFSYDNVFLNPDHLPYLNNQLDCLHMEEKKGRVPYMAGLKAPYYIFIGRKKSCGDQARLVANSGNSTGQ